MAYPVTDFLKSKLSAAVLAALVAMGILYYVVTKPAPAPTPAAYRVNWAQWPNKPIARWCRFVTGNPLGVQAYDAQDAGKVLAYYKAAVDKARADGAGYLIGWDCAAADYTGDVRSSNIPIATWTAAFNYAAANGIVPGIELTGGKPLMGGWYADDAATIAATVETIQYHRGLGCRIFYWDSNSGGGGGRTKEQNLLLVRTVAAQVPDCLVLPENWDASLATAYGYCGPLWLSWGNGGTWWTWYAPPPNFDGRLACFVNQWSALRPDQQAAFSTWANAHPDRVQILYDVWYSGPSVPWKP